MARLSPRSVVAAEKTTTVDVRTFEPDGDGADRGFHVHAVC